MLDQLSTKHSTKIRPTQSSRKPVIVLNQVPRKGNSSCSTCGTRQARWRVIYLHVRRFGFASVYDYWILELFNSVVCLLFILLHNRIVGVMVSVLTSSVVYRVVKSVTAKLIFVSSPLSTHHKGVRTQTGWLWIRIMCPNGATCLPAHCCWSSWSHHFEKVTVATITWLTGMEYLCHKWPRICTTYYGFLTRLTRRVPVVEHKLLTIPWHLSSTLVLVGFALLGL